MPNKTTTGTGTFPCPVCEREIAFTVTVEADTDNRLMSSRVKSAAIDHAPNCATVKITHGITWEDANRAKVNTA